jgi:hypothetical protein
MGIPTLTAALTTLRFTIGNLGDRFQRQAIWSPASVMTMVLLLKTPGQKFSYRSVLSLVDRLGSSLLPWSHTPTIGSMAKARAKLSVAACRQFQREIARQVTRALHRPRHVWGKRRIIGVDGSTFVVPRSADTLQHFRCPKGGEHGPAAHHPRALMVLAMDVLRRVPVSYVLGRKGQGERTLIKDLLETFQPGDVVVIDRGFPSRELLMELTKRKIDVVMRVSAEKAATWKEFRPFLSGTKKTADLTLELGRKKEQVSIKARLVERDRQRGRPRRGTKKERMILLTTLREEDGFTRAELIKIYGSRWGVETAFRELKTFMDTEPFHSKSAAGIEQELVAGQIWMTLASLLESTALDGVPEGYRVVRTDCYRFAGVLLGDFLAGRYREEEFMRLVNELRRYAQSRKPDRYAERTCNVPFGRSQKQFG